MFIGPLARSAFFSRLERMTLSISIVFIFFFATVFNPSLAGRSNSLDLGSSHYSTFISKNISQKCKKRPCATPSRLPPEPKRMAPSHFGVPCRTRHDTSAFSCGFRHNRMPLSKNSSFKKPLEKSTQRQAAQHHASSVFFFNQHIVKNDII